MRTSLLIVAVATFAYAIVSFTPVHAQDAGTSGPTTAPATSIFDAVHAGNIDQVKALIGQDPSLAKAIDHDGGVSALIEAVAEGKAEVAKFLIEKGADINSKAANNWTPIYLAAANGEVDVVKLLVEKGAAVNFDVHPDAEGDDPGCTPLLVAAQNGQLDVVKFLLDKGANVDTAASYNTLYETATPLIAATEVSADFDRLGQGQPLGTRVATKKEHGYLEVVAALLDKGAKIDAKNNFGNTALQIAAGNGQADVVKLLLDKGASVDLGNNEDVTPLIMASQNGDLQVVKLLLAKGADPNHAMSTKGGQKAWTPILIAQANGFKDVVDLLQKTAATRPAK